MVCHISICRLTGKNRGLTYALRTFVCLLFLHLGFASHAIANNSEQNKRIVTLSPHLTEIVFSLGLGANIVGVSDYSDYPDKAKEIKSIASYEGANIAEIVRLKPTHILVWRGGNKDADIQKLGQLGFKVYESNIQSVDQLFTDIRGIGAFLGLDTEAATLVASAKKQTQDISKQYKNKRAKALYYMNNQPLIGLGNDPWLNDLLALCGIQNVYIDSIAGYPQLQLSDIIRKQPELIIAANHAEQNVIEQFWKLHQRVLNAKIVKANPDALHRFTLRAIDEINRICELSYQ